MGRRSYKLAGPDGPAYFGGLSWGWDPQDGDPRETEASQVVKRPRWSAHVECLLCEAGEPHWEQLPGHDDCESCYEGHAIRWHYAPVRSAATS
jgi:hypothetical protein